jgi:2-polyprenyl-3-methyl-5-hydroxy-6-metoxy-1,4-benzoquinol methylase
LHDKEQPSTIDWFLADMRTYFDDTQPSLLALFDIYAEEAAFGRRYIASDLESLPIGAKILEVGAGSLLLSCQLIREGFQVTALEPIGTGFSHFEQMRQTVLARAATLGCLPRNLDIVAESLTESETFDYAFSINVMEHVENISIAIARIVKSLKMGSSYRFTSPNYLFPYEPHFNIPTLFSKRVTEKMLGKKIFGSKKIADPAGTWQSLNWINVIQVRKIVQQLPGLKVIFNRCLLVVTIERIASDPDFASRRSSMIRIILLLLLKSQLHRLLQFVPAALQPIIDCKLQKAMVSEAS